MVRWLFIVGLGMAALAAGAWVAIRRGWFRWSGRASAKGLGGLALVAAAG